jgi:uncharacterized protein
MKAEQCALRFRCHASWLIGILSLPQQPVARGVLIVTAGPQYRVGSHRQFTLLARHLAEQAIPVMRFDYRGMGDSEGESRGFESIGDDLQCAMLEFFSAVPQMKEVVIWGLCDGASAAALYASQDRRVCGLILLNPSVRTAQGAARATLKHWWRLLEPDFWRKLIAGAVEPGAAHALLRQLLGAASRRPASLQAPLPARLFESLSQFQGKILIVLSGADLTAREFSDLQNSSAPWRCLANAPHVQQVHMAGANHTFARRDWREQVEQLCAAWVTSW